MKNILKILAFSLCITATGLIVSCSKESKIVGKWVCTSSSTSHHTPHGHQTSTDDYVGQFAFFSEDGTCNIAGVSYNYFIKDDKLFVSQPNTSSTSYSEFEIMELSSNNMSLFNTSGYTSIYDNYDYYDIIDYDTMEITRNFEKF